MASTPPKEPPTLPVELLLPIIKLSLPPAVLATSTKRTAALLVLCRVSRAFCHIAGGLLYRDVFLVDFKQTGRFLKCTEGGPRRELVTGLWLGPPDGDKRLFGNADAAERMLQGSINVRRVYLSCIRALSPRAVVGLLNLKHLHLSDLTFADPVVGEASPVLPSITHLTFVMTAATSLNAATLPSLTHLALPARSSDWAELRLLNSLAPQIRSLHLGADPPCRQLSAVLAASKKWQQLDDLSIPTLWRDYDPFVACLTRPVSTLRLFDPDQGPVDILRHLRRSDCVGLNGLKRLLLPKPLPTFSEEMSSVAAMKDASVRRELAALCESRGIVLMDHESGHGASSRTEDV